ncbi:MAG: hypothetical protein AAFY65_10930 [Pseudomonadota bacterium]
MDRKMRAALLAVVLLTLLGSLLVGRSEANPANCRPLDAMRDHLATRWSETPVLVADGRLQLIIFAASDGKTWTAVQVTPAGRACMVSSGTNWAAFAPVARGDDI